VAVKPVCNRADRQRDEARQRPTGGGASSTTLISTKILGSLVLPSHGLQPTPTHMRRPAAIMQVIGATA